MKLDLAIEPTVQQLAGLNEQLDSVLAGQRVDPERIGQVRLIVEELACNAIAHGARGQARAPLRLRLQLDPAALVLEFRDDGHPFDPCRAAPPALDADLGERPIGGLGLYLVNQIADHIAYHRDGAYNVVRVTLLHPHSPVAESLP